MPVAAACPGLDCVAHKFGVISQKIRVFFGKGGYLPQGGKHCAWQGAQGHARTHAMPHRPAL
jgi:hypothetical protein